EPGALSKLSAQTVYVKADSRTPFQAVLTVLDALRGKSVVLLAASPAKVDKAKIVSPYGIKVIVSRGGPPPKRVSKSHRRVSALLFSQMRYVITLCGKPNRDMKETDVRQGTLVLMVLKTLDVLGTLHGYGSIKSNFVCKKRGVP